MVKELAWHCIVLVVVLYWGKLLMSNKFNHKANNNKYAQARIRARHAKIALANVRKLKAVPYTDKDTCDSRVLHPQIIPIQAHISAKSEYANYQRNVIDKRLGKTDIQVKKSENKYYKNIPIIAPEYVPYSILPSKDSE